MSFRLARTAAAAVLASALTAATASAATPSAYVYATSWNQTVRQYSADDAGALSDLAPSEVGGTGLTSVSAAASPDGRRLYVVNQTSGTVTQYDIAVDGTLAPKIPDSVATGSSPQGLAVAPDSRHVYVVNQGDRTVGVYGVDGAGALTSTSSAAAGRGAAQIALSPDGSSAYVTNLTEGSISQYDVGADGALTPKDPAAVAAGSRPSGIAVSADGASVYVTNQVASGTVSQFSADPETGALTRQAQPTVPAGNQPRGILAAAGRVYVANSGSDSISQYSADGSGALSQLAPATATVRTPFGLALSPDADSVYVAGFADGVVGQLDVTADGTLAAKAPPSVSANPNPVAVVAVKPRDEQAPTIDLRTPAEGAEYEQGADVRADYSCADEGGSGLQSCTGDVPDGDRLDTATPGPHTFTVVARDGAGHVATVTHEYSVAPDEQAPAVDLGTPADGAEYEQGADVDADYACADDGGSGLRSCMGDVPDGDPLDTSTPGSHDFTVTARDGEGNETTVTHTYTVTEPAPEPGLGFEGFLGPIHDGSVVRAGDAIPIVFSLGGFQGDDVVAAGSPTSVQVDCDDPGEPTGGDPASSASSRGLFFNQWTQHYVFMWQTSKAWAGTCRTFVLSLRDGSVERLAVSFRSGWRRYW
jgi:6-phosphogluconolactonase (cycloisomerase 2 family)